jgi:hypothetical protein
LGLNSTPLTALVTPAEQGSSPAFWFYAAGAGLLLVGMVGMVYWLAQRRSGTAQASFITKSMHRK